MLLILLRSGIVAAAVCVSATSALANQALAIKNNCLGCHAAATQLVGPAYRDVAARYAGQSDAADTLIKSIKNGSSGKWGDLAMPPHPDLSAADARKLANWILGGAK